MDLSDQTLSQSGSNKVDVVSNAQGDKIAYISRNDEVHDIGLLRSGTGKLEGFDTFSEQTGRWSTAMGLKTHSR